MPRLTLVAILFAITPTLAAQSLETTPGPAVVVRSYGLGGLVATVYVDRVNAVAYVGGVDSAILLARAIAHEIGHLLMGTTQHASNGLMRAVWSQAELRRQMAADWQFSKAEAQAMRRALRNGHVGGTTETVIADGQQKNFANQEDAHQRAVDVIIDHSR